MEESLSNSPDDLLDDAEAAVETEIRLTTAERDAFQAFIDRVGELSPRAAATTSGLAPVQTVTRTDGLTSIRKAYESTVMAVSHYEKEYDEPYATNVRTELGPDVATLLTSGQVFEPHHKHAVLTAAEEAKNLRGKLVDALEEERQSVQEFREPLCTVATNIASLETTEPEAQSSKLLDGYRRRLDVLEQRCHELISMRQSRVVDGRRALALPISGPDIPTYVYQDLPTNYPVVATLTELIERAAIRKAELER